MSAVDSDDPAGDAPRRKLDHYLGSASTTPRHKTRRPPPKAITPAQAPVWKWRTGAEEKQSSRCWCGTPFTATLTTQNGREVGNPEVNARFRELGCPPPEVRDAIVNAVWAANSARLRELVEGFWTDRDLARTVFDVLSTVDLKETLEGWRGELIGELVDRLEDEALERGEEFDPETALDRSYYGAPTCPARPEWALDRIIFELRLDNENAAGVVHAAFFGTADPRSAS